MRHTKRPHAARRGSAIITTVLVLMVVMGLSGAIMTLGMGSKSEQRASTEDLQALYAAESGVSDAIADLAAGRSGGLGTPIKPVDFSGGGYWVTTQDHYDSTYTIRSYATVRTGDHALEVVVRAPLNVIYSQALMAGNAARDPNYALHLSGNLPKGDTVDGDVYSGGDVLVEDDAAILGSIRATGTIVGANGQTGVAMQVPDIPSMQYDTNHDVDVASAFAGASWGGSALGGSAWQLPASDPAHIFRKNPSDRSTYTAKTAKDDYYLEDPWETLGTDPARNGSNAHPITLSGTGGQPGTNGNQLVYFIDGNLWVHNLQTNSFRFDNSDPEGFRVTFVVKGNVYLNDNLFYGDPNLDGVAFVAISDPSEHDSGNVYLGDLLDGSVAPIGASLSHVDAFLFAERDLFESSIDRLGLGSVTYRGNLTAGNHIVMKKDAVLERQQLLIDHDDRLVTGSLDLPQLPKNPADFARYQVLSWRTIAF